MNVGAPLGLLALTAVIPLVAAYFLRRRQKPVRVSALFLWQSPDQRAEAGPRLERFSRELSLLLELLAVLAATVFLADVGCSGPQRGRHLVVVVDGSLSMSARLSGGESVPERVRQAVARAVASEGAERLTVVESGSPPRVLAGPAAPASTALSTLAAWRPLRGSHSPERSWSLARDLAGEGQRVRFFTDAIPEDGGGIPSWLQIEAVGAPAENVAIVAAHRADEGDLARITLRVANFGGEAKTLDALISEVRPGKAPAVEQRQAVSVPAGGTAQLTIGLRGVDAVTVTLPPDALPEDGEVTLLPSPPRPVGVAFADDLDPAATAALRRFFSVAPGVLLDAPQPVLTFGGTAANGSNVIVGASAEKKTFVGPFFAEKTSPILDDVSLGGVVWTAGANPPGRTLLAAGEVVLVSEEVDGKLHLNLELGRSNVQRTPAWPVMLGNLVRRARASLPGFSRRHVTLGEELPVVVTAGATHAFRGPGGDTPLLGAGALTLAAPQLPGRYELLREGEPIDALQVLAIDPSESDLRARGAGVRESELKPGLSEAASDDRSPWPLVLMLGLLLGDFALTARGRA